MRRLVTKGHTTQHIQCVQRTHEFCATRSLQQQRLDRPGKLADLEEAVEARAALELIRKVGRGIVRPVNRRGHQGTDPDRIRFGREARHVLVAQLLESQVIEKIRYHTTGIGALQRRLRAKSGASTQRTPEAALSLRSSRRQAEQSLTKATEHVTIPRR